MKCVWMALVAVRVVLAGDFVLQEYLPPDTKVVTGLRVRALTESSLFKQNDQKAMSENMLKVAGFSGFDPLHDLDEVIITSSADRENAPVLIVMRGRFNLEKLGAGAPTYHGVAMRGNSDKGAAGVLALLDDTTALAGDLPLVKWAIDRRGQPVIYDKALVARVTSLRERFDLWGVGERPEGFVAPGGQNEQLNSIDRFEFGVGITKGLELGAEVHARSSKDTEKLAASLGMLQMMARAQSNSAKFDVKVEENTLKLSFAISEEELKKALAAQQAQTQRTLSQAQPQTPATMQPKVFGQPMTTSGAQTTTPGGTSVFTLPGKK